VALANLKAMVGGEHAYLVELIDTFLEDSPKLVSAMQQAVIGADAPALRLSAHSLKSNAADFGAAGLAELCRQLEAAGKSNDLTGTPNLLAQVVSAHTAVTEALAAVREQ
jgi:HPt (histidine-containing phosphotransfer) domain-containing protein